ncbi:MAG: hypothetical protein VKK04_00120 [Synechococcales bacterium]|nr:hypothetical protein [Synechococcales bacterium]
MKPSKNYLLWLAIAVALIYLLSPVGYFQFRYGYPLKTVIVPDIFPPAFDSWYTRWFCFYNRHFSDKKCSHLGNTQS